jgi:hypothetical protein
MSDSQKKTAILKSHEDWDDWIQFIRSKCSKHIWGIIDPELRNDSAKEPIPKPIRPKPSNVRARAQYITHFCHGTRPYGQGRHLESGYWLWILAIHHQHEDPPAMHRQHEDPQRPTESSKVYSIIPQLRTYGYIREAVSMYSRFPSSSLALE